VGLAHRVAPGDIAPAIMAEASLRFWGYVEKGEGDECWTWTASIETAGYGQFNVDGRKWRAHRFSLLLDGQVLLAGKVVRHLCHNKSCINPAHLVQGTYAENYADTKARKAEIVYLKFNEAPSPEEVATGGGWDEDFWDEVLG
jgi:hypothetical protein